MKKKSIISQLSSHLFWDVELDLIDETKHRRYIIVRVMDRGNRNDVDIVWKHYGPETIKKELLHAPALHRKTLFFFANQFNLKPQDFRAYHKQKELGTWSR